VLCQPNNVLAPRPRSSCFDGWPPHPDATASTLSRQGERDICGDDVVKPLPKLSEDVLLTVFDRMNNFSKDDLWDFDSAFVAIGSDATVDQRAAVASFLVKKGWGYFENFDDGTKAFVLSDVGEGVAISIYELRRPKTIIDRLKAISRSEWISIGSLIVSIIALAIAWNQNAQTH
jgi:hypothetical protein